MAPQRSNQTNLEGWPLCKPISPASFKGEPVGVRGAGDFTAKGEQGLSLDPSLDKPVTKET